MRRLTLSVTSLLLLSPLALAANLSPVPTRANTFDVQRRLDINSLNLYVSNSGILGFDSWNFSPGLLYPRGSWNSVLFSSGLWVGATVNGQTRVVTADYSSEYGPGSMIAGTFEDPVSPGLVVWKVLRWSGDPADTAHVDRTPGELAADPTMDPVAHHGWGEYMAYAAPRGAPVRTWPLPGPGGVGVVNVTGPDVTGDQLLWCVFNDADPQLHQNYGASTAPLGIEVQQSVFGFNRSEALGQTAFVHWRILNKGGQMLTAARAAFWLDPDIGGASDDLVGCDSTRSLGFAYNATNSDFVYGSHPPALGVDLLGPGRAAVFARYANGADPANASEIVNVMAGLNPDGSAVINPTTGLPSAYHVSGDPVAGTGWLDSAPADRRMLISRSPLALAPGDMMDVWAALVVGQAGNRLASITMLKCWDGYVQQVWDLGFPADLSVIPSVCGGVTAALAALVSASAQPGRAEITWDVSGTPAAQVQRFAPDQSWQTLGEATITGTGRVRWQDAGVAPGARYGYRLALGAGGGAPYAGETWLEIPRVAQLAIAGFSPNPGTGPVSLRFSLPAAGPARVQVLDLAGREVVARDVAGLGPGTHAVPLGSTLVPGIYWLRLSQGGASLSAKGVLLR